MKEEKLYTNLSLFYQYSLLSNVGTIGIIGREMELGAFPQFLSIWYQGYDGMDLLDIFCCHVLDGMDFLNKANNRQINNDFNLEKGQICTKKWLQKYLHHSKSTEKV